MAWKRAIGFAKSVVNDFIADDVMSLAAAVAYTVSGPLGWLMGRLTRKNVSPPAQP